MKELFHFVDCYHQLSEELLLKCIVGVNNKGALVLVLNFGFECCGVEEHVWVDIGLTAHY